MKNSILNFETEELDEFIVQDYFSKKIDLYNLFLTLDIEEYLTLYKIQDNDKIERISYELYNSTDYWDLILLLNERNPLFHLPSDYDAIFDDTEEFVKNYINVIYSPNNKIPNTISGNTIIYEELLKQYLEEMLQLNETYRIIYVPKPERLTDFIILLKNEGYL